MSEEIPNFTAGVSLKWTRKFLIYPASLWSLIYHFRGNGAGFDVIGTPSGEAFTCLATTEQTANCSAGNYAYQGFVENQNEKVLVESGNLRVHPNLSQIGAADLFDGRSPARKILDAIDAMVHGKATLDQQSYQIGNRQLARIPIPDLILLREKYQRIVNEEERLSKQQKGGSFLKNIAIRFTQPK